MEHENFTDNNKEIQDTEASLPAADSVKTPENAPKETTDNTEQKEVTTSGHNTVPDNSGSDKDASGDSNNKSVDSTGSPNASMSVSSSEASEKKTEKETDTGKDTKKETDIKEDTKKDTEKETVSGNSLEDKEANENNEADENSKNETEASSIFTGAGQDIDYSDLSGIGEGISAILADNETYYTETLTIQKEIHEELQHVSFLLECTFTVACAVGFLIAVHVGGKLVDYFWNRLRG